MPISLIAHFGQFGWLSPEEKQAIRDAATRIRYFGPDEDLVSLGDHPTDCKLILSGYACAYKLLLDGRRQILSFQIPGDICDLPAFFLGRMDHAIGTLTSGNVAIIPHEVLLDLMQTYPRIGRALSHSILVDAATAREWMVRLGRRTAYERIAHLLCELWLRLDAVGLTQGNNFKLPVTQARLADALGLTPVHVNRMLKQLCGSGLITLRGGTVRITDWEGLRIAGEFTPDYLYLGQNSRLQRPPGRLCPSQSRAASNRGFKNLGAAQDLLLIER